MEKNKINVKAYILTFLIMLLSLTVNVNGGGVFLKKSDNNLGVVLAEEVVSDGLNYSYVDGEWEYYDDLSGYQAIYLNGLIVDSFSSENASNNTGTLQIPSTYNGEPVVGVGHGFAGNSVAFYFDTVIIPSSVKLIMGNSFRNVETLTKIVFEENSKLEVILDGAFTENENLSEINLPNSVRHIGHRAFAYNYNMRSGAVILPSSLEYIGKEAFNDSISAVFVPASINYVSDFAFGYDWVNILLEGDSSSTNNWAYDWSGDGNNIYYNVSLSDDFIYYNGQILAYIGNGGDVVIPREINEMEITSVASGVFTGNSKITSLFVPNSISGIGFDEPNYMGAFQNMANLKSVVFESNSSLISLNNNMFAENYNLENIVLPDSLEVIEDGVFNENYSLYSITLPVTLTQFEHSYGLDRLINVRNLSSIPNQVISDIFSENILLEIVNDISTDFENVVLHDEINKIKTINVGEYNYLFSYEGNEKVLNLYNYPSINAIYPAALINANNLKVIELSNNFTSLKQKMFYRSNVGVVIVPETVVNVEEHPFVSYNGTPALLFEGTEDTVTYQPDYFEGLEYQFGVSAQVLNDFVVNLDEENNATIIKYIGNGGEVVVPSYLNGGVSEVVTIGVGAFAESNVTSVFIRNSIINIESGAFSNSNKLTSVVFEENSNLLEIGNNAFEQTSLNSIIIPKSVEVIGNNAFWGIQEYSSGFRLEFEESSSLTTIGNGAFNSASLIGEVIIPNSVTTIGEGAFSRNLLLTSIIFEESAKVQVFEMGVFESTGLAKFEIPASVHTIKQAAFTQVSNSLKLFIPNNVLTIENNAFSSSVYTSHESHPDGWGYNITWRNVYYGVNFENGYLYGNIDENSVEILGYSGNEVNLNMPSQLSGKIVSKIANEAFRGSLSINSVVVPNTVKVIGEYAFGWVNPQSVEGYNTNFSIIFEENSKLEVIGIRAFADSTMSEITIPNSVKFINEYAFGGVRTSNYNVNFSVKFEENSKLEVIGIRAFADSTMSEITIPNSVKTISEYAFANTNILTSVSFEEGSNLKTIESFAFSQSGFTNIALPVGIVNMGNLVFANGYNKNIYMQESSVPSGWSGNWAYKYEWENETHNVILNANIWNGFIYSNYGAAGVEVNGYLGSLVADDNNVADFVIPNEINGKPVVRIGNEAFANRAFGNVFINLFIPNTIESIGISAFGGAGISNLTFEENSSLTNIEDMAFYNSMNNSGMNIALPKSLKTIGEGAFYLNTSAYSFESGSVLETIKSFAFGTDRYLLSDQRSFIIPETVVNIEPYAFAYGNPVNIYVSVSENETPVGWKDGWSELNPELSSGHHNIYWNSLVFENYLYEYIDSSSIRLTTYLPSNIIDNTVIIPKTINGVNVVEIGEGLFAYKDQGIFAAPQVFVPNTIELIGFESFRDSGFRGVIFEENSNLKTISSYGFYYSNLINIVLPNSVTHIEDHAFAWSSDLGSVVLNEGIEYIGENAFQFIGIEEISSRAESNRQDDLRFGDVYVNSETIPSNWHYDWAGATNSFMSFSNGYVSIVSTATVNMGVVLTEGDFVYYKNNELNQSYILRYLGNDENLIIPSSLGGASVVKIASGAFMNSSLTSVTIPNTVVVIENGAFIESLNLSSVNLEPSASLKTIENEVFLRTSLISINLSASLEFIGEGSFGYFIESVIFHENSLLKVIPNLAFAGSVLSELVLPASVEFIYNYGLAYIQSDLKLTLLRSASLGITALQQNDNGEHIIYGFENNEYSRNLTIVVGGNSLDVYRNSDSWGFYYNNIFTEIVLVANNIEITYGDENPSLTYEFRDVSGEVVNVQGANVNIYRDSGDSVGYYTIYIDTDYYDENVILTTKNGLFTINAKVIEVNWDNLEFVYNGENQAPNPIVDGGFDYTIISEESINAGVYVIEIEVSNTNPNIIYSNLRATYEILPIIINITPQDGVPIVKTYDGTTNVNSNVLNNRLLLTINPNFAEYAYVYDNEKDNLEIKYLAEYISKDVNFSNNNVIVSNLAYLYKDNSQNVNFVFNVSELLFAGVIEAKDVNVVWSDSVVEYNGDEQYPTPSVITGVTNDILNLVPSAKYENAGTYIVEAIPTADASNYNISNLFIDFVIQKKDLRVSVSDIISKVYDGTTNAYGYVEFEFDGLIYGDVAELNYTANFNSASVEEADEVYINLIEVLNENYNLLTSILINEGIITTNIITINWSDNDLVYNKQLQVPYYTITTGIIGDDFKISVSGGGINAGDYTAVATLNVPSSNYQLINTEKQFKIVPKTLQIVGVNLSVGKLTKVYDGAANALLEENHYQIYGLMQGDEFAFDYVATFDNENVGINKEIEVANLVSLNPNYEFENSSFTVKGDITHRKLNVIWKNLEFTYNGRPVSPDVELEGLINGDIIDVSIAGATSQAGTHLAEAVIGNINSNYALSNLTTTFTINPKLISVFGLTGVSKEYDGTLNAELKRENYSFIGAVSGDDINIISHNSKYNDANVAGASLVSVSNIVIDNANYVLENNSFTVAGSINKKLLLVELFGVVSKTYDGGVEAYLTKDNYSFEGVVNGDEVELLFSAEFETRNVGSDIRVYVYVSGVNSNNYQVNGMVDYITGDITRKLITIKQSANITKGVDSDDPLLNYEAVGLVEGDELNGKLTREEGESVGFYDILPGTLTSEFNPNYNFDYELAYLQITPFQVWPIIIAVILGAVFIGSVVISRALLRGGKRKVTSLEEELS